MLSDEFWNFVLNTEKSGGLIDDVGRPPSLIFDTVATPTITKLFSSIIWVTFAKDLTLVLPRRLFVNATRSPGLIWLVNSVTEVTVEIPGADPDLGDIVTLGREILADCFVSPLKVIPVPTSQ